MARVQLARKRRRSPRIEIIPMVDVMFLLLVFYILSSLALHHQRGIAVTLPAAQSADAGGESEDFVVSVTPEGDYYVDKVKVSGDKLGPALDQWARSLPGGSPAVKKVSVVLNADLKAQHRYVVAAIDALRKIGVNNFVISTEPPAQAPKP